MAHAQNNLHEMGQLKHQLHLLRKQTAHERLKDFCTRLANDPFNYLL